ncbi:TPA: hypothetical protein ACF2DE_002933 [Clostridium perfringens]
MKIKVVKAPPHQVGTQSKIKIGTIRNVLYKSIPDGKGIIEYKINYKGKNRYITNEYCIEV